MGADLSPAKRLVHRLVHEVINENHPDVLDLLCTERLAPKLHLAFTQFRDAFPDWQQEIIHLVEEDDTVVARFRCTGTQSGAWQGLAPSGRHMQIDEVAFYRITDDRISGVWALEDTWTRMHQLAGDDATLGDLGSLT